MKGRKTKTANPNALAALRVLLHKTCLFAGCRGDDVGKATNTIHNR